MRRFLFRLMSLVMFVSICILSYYLYQKYEELQYNTSSLSKNIISLEKFDEIIDQKQEVYNASNAKKEKYIADVAKLINESENPKKKFFEVLTISSPGVLTEYEKKSIDVLANIPDPLIYYVFKNKPFTFYCLESKDEQPVLEEQVFSIDYNNLENMFSDAHNMDANGFYNVSNLFSKYANITLLGYTLDEAYDCDAFLEGIILHEFGHALFYSDEKNEKMPFVLDNMAPFKVILSVDTTEKYVTTTYQIIDYFLESKSECFAELFFWKLGRNDYAKTIYSKYKQLYPEDANIKELEKLLDQITSDYKSDAYNYGQLYTDILNEKVKEELDVGKLYMDLKSKIKSSFFYKKATFN